MHAIEPQGMRLVDIIVQETQNLMTLGHSKAGSKQTVITLGHTRHMTQQNHPIILFTDLLHGLQKPQPFGRPVCRTVLCWGTDDIVPGQVRTEPHDSA